MILESQTQTHIPPKPKSTPKIMVVDDEFGPRESLRLILSPNYDVVLAADGREALTRFETDEPDMVISDIRMPKLDGIELMKQIKDRDPDIPFVLLTGFGTLESAQEAIRIGAFDYISKPYDVEEIRDVVSRAFNERCQSSEMNLTLERLQTTNSELERTIQSLDKKAVLGELSAETLHDLNNPFCAIQGYVELLEGTLAKDSHFAESEERTLLEEIKIQASRCLQLTQQFLEYARNCSPDWNQADVNTLLRNTLSTFKTSLADADVRLEVDLDTSIPKVFVQITPLQQALHNLVTNALQAMRETSRPRVLTVSSRCLQNSELTSSGPVLEIRIQDSGPGIPAAIRDKIFTRFFTTKPQGQGTGIGLSICRRVVQEHRGRIRVNSDEGHGSVFTILLPLREQSGADQDS